MRAVSPDAKWKGAACRELKLKKGVGPVGVVES
jgi:hypothetical protein